MIKIKDLIKEQLKLQQKNVQKGKWVQPMLKYRGQQLIYLVQNAYKKTKQGAFVNSKGDLPSSKWLAMDFDHDPELDVTIFYRKPRGNEPWKGYKIQGIGHDGTLTSIQVVLNKLKEILNKKGYWIEASDQLQKILYRMGAPYIKDQELARRIFPNTNLMFIGKKGKYVRNLGNKKIQETIFGNLII